MGEKILSLPDSDTDFICLPANSKACLEYICPANFVLVEVDETTHYLSPSVTVMIK
jgi:hypothetical protein